jgi:hypothetical protein
MTQPRKSGVKNPLSKDRQILTLLIFAFFTLALAWNLAVPPYENLDEIEHFEVTRYIAVTGRLPVHQDPDVAGFHVGQEASQPPLYHILGAGWMRLLGLSRDALAVAPVPEDVVACGPSGTFYNKATWTHNPYDGIIWQGPRLTLHMLRLFSTLLQIATLLGTWTLARRVFPRGVLPALVTAIVAFNPQFLLVAAGVNNDNLITPLATWGLVLAFDLAVPSTPREKGGQGSHGAQRFKIKVLLYGVLSGLAALSKLSGLALVGLGGVILLGRAWRPRRPWRERVSFRHLLQWGALMIVPMLLIVSPWVIRNVLLYGDPTALKPMLNIVGRRTPPPIFSESRLMLLSYWGQLPCSFYPRAIYWPYLLLMAGGLLGLLMEVREHLMGFHHSRGGARLIALGIAALWFLVIVVAWVRWNSITPAPGGRLLFPAIAALALLLTAGWDKGGQRGLGALSITPRFIAAFLPLWALVTLRAGPIEIFAPPPLLSEDNFSRLDLQLQPFTFGPQATDSQATQVGIAQLHGYEAQIVNPHFACVFASSTYCNPSLSVDLLWQPVAPFHKNWTLAIQLVSPIPGETDLLLNYNHWPGHGNLPTSAWPSSSSGISRFAQADSSTLIRDSYILPMSNIDVATQAWDVQVALFDVESGVRLPVRMDGQPVGDRAPIATLRVPGENPLCPTSTQGALLSPSPRLGDAIDLQAAVVEPSGVSESHDGQGPVWRVTLCWESVAALSEDYTVFVHAYNAEGELLATGDGPPMRGAFPTRLWAPGDRILDVHHLALDVEDESAIDQLLTIAVGLYHPVSGARLPAVQDEDRLLNDAVPVWEGP